MTTDRQAIVISNEQEDLYGNIYNDIPQIDRKVLANALYTSISNMSLDEVVAIITNPYKEILEYIGLTQGAQLCKNTSLLFNPHRLDTRTSSSKQSIYEALSNQDFHNGLARVTIWKSGSVTELFYSCIQVGLQGVQYVNEFPPHVARDYCTDYLLNADSHVLDPCAGWGGRLIGCSVIAGTYTGYEPSTRTAAGLAKLSTFIQTMTPEFDATIHCQPYEDSDEHPDYYDLAITSPPYYDTELYSDEETNSLNRYKSFDAWCDGFYYPLIDKTMRQLKPGAPFIINIGNRQWPLATRLRTHAADRYDVTELRPRLQQGGGLRRDTSEGEAFYMLRNRDETNWIEQLF